MLERADSLAVLFRQAHGAYAQSLNARRGRSGHLWQNRFYSCPMSESHLWLGIPYVEANPLRMATVNRVEDYRWSSAGAHLSGGKDPSGALDHAFWKHAGGIDRWRGLHAAGERPSETHLLRRCTYAGRPFGDEAFVERIQTAFQRKWRR